MQPTSNTQACNCRNIDECPLDNKYLTTNMKQWWQHPANQLENILVLQKLHLKVVSPTFLLVCFLSLNKSTCQLLKNAFCFISKAPFILEKIKF